MKKFELWLDEKWADRLYDMVRVFRMRGEKYSVDDMVVIATQTGIKQLRKENQDILDLKTEEIAHEMFLQISDDVIRNIYFKRIDIRDHILLDDNEHRIFDYNRLIELIEDRIKQKLRS
jgi:hypothetical protein